MADLPLVHPTSVATPRALDFSAVVREQQPALRRLAGRLVWDADEAQDLVQECLADAFERWHTLEHSERAAAWLRRILVHRALSLLRRRKLWATLRRFFATEPELSPAADWAHGRSQHLVLLASGLAELAARQRTAFTLRYLEGLSLDEVASSMGIDRGTVRVHLQRALGHLRARGLLLGDEP